MKGVNLVALHSIDSGLNEPGEFIIGVVDAEGALHQVSGQSKEVGGFLNEFVSSLEQDEDGSYRLPDGPSGG